MTISTDGKAKKIKASGPIRWGAVVPFGIMILLMGLYTHFFFDSHLKKIIAWSAGKIHGAEVNISELKTRFLKGSFFLNKLEVTSKEKPTENLIEIGQIRFEFSWDALLRAKFVVEDAAIEGIEANTKRKKIGKLYPKEIETAAEIKAKNEAVEYTKKVALGQLKEDFSQNALGDIASIIGGTSKKQQLKKLTSELQSEKRIKEIEKEIKIKEAEWKEILTNLPDKEYFKKISQRSKEINFKEKNPLKLIGEIKKLKELISETNHKIKTIKTVSEKLKKDMTKYAHSVTEIDELIEADMAFLQKRMEVPDIDFKGFAFKIFGKMFAEKASSIKKYVDMAQKYMPPQKSAKEKAQAQAEKVLPYKRGEGKTYSFPITAGHPLFWLKKASISSRSSPESPMSGDISGAISNLTSDPVYIGKAGLITFNGDFPHQKIFKMAGRIAINHHLKDGPNHETFSLKIASYPVGEKEFSKSSKLAFGIKKAMGSLHTQGKIDVGGKVRLSLDNNFQNIDYLIKAKNKHVQEVFSGVLKDTPKINVNAQAFGHWNNLDWKIRSNLSTDLSRGLKKQVKAKIAKEKQKIRSLIDKKIAGKKQALTEKLRKSQEKINQILAKNKKKIEELKNKLTGKLAATKKKNNVQKKAKDGLKKALKKFKFKL